MKPITLIVLIQIKPDTEAQFLMATNISKAATLKEPGCHEYRIHKDVTKENTFVLIETYESQEAIDKHRSSKHFEAWREIVQPFMETPRIAHKCTTL